MEEFEEIYAQYYSVVYKYTLSLCRNEKMAEDVTQEAFFKALKNINQFIGHSKIETWLCQIAKNTYFSMYEKNKREAQIELTSKVDDIECNLIAKETKFEVHKVVHGLEEPYKEIFLLRMFGELSFAQIGELFGKTESWARIIFYRAKLKIRDGLSKNM